MKFTYHILSLIFFISLVISLVLTLTPTPNICSPTEGCNIVLTSTYASILGVKNSLVGIFAFLTLTIFSLMQIKKQTRKKKNFILFGVIVGSAISLCFIYLQAFIIHSWCKYCLVVDVGLLISLIVIVLSKKN